MGIGTVDKITKIAEFEDKIPNSAFEPQHSMIPAITDPTRILIHLRFVAYLRYSIGYTLPSNLLVVISTSTVRFMDCNILTRR